MRRLARHLFTLCSVLSLLLCMAFGALWVRGYEAMPLGRRPADGLVTRRAPVLAVSRGRLYVGVVGPVSTSQGRLWMLGDFRYDERQLFDRAADGSRRPVGSARVAVFPAWSLAAATAVLPAWWYVAWRRSTRPAPGCCPACGYDLRASPERCPECGATPPLRVSA